ncbi:hypothetical protein SUGI_1146400 [Cryptomeria japonica]|nr:hypothetical protein SUGI_1146400 [Cryptomeria japonica]
MVVWEEIWGEHMHHDFYLLNNLAQPNVDHRAAQITMIEQTLSFADLSEKFVAALRPIVMSFATVKPSATMKPFVATLRPAVAAIQPPVRSPSEIALPSATIDDFRETMTPVLPHRKMRWEDVSFDDHDLAQLQTSNNYPQWVVKDGCWRDLAYDKFLPASSYFRKFTSNFVPKPLHSYYKSFVPKALIFQGILVPPPIDHPKTPFKRCHSFFGSEKPRKRRSVFPQPPFDICHGFPHFDGFSPLVPSISPSQDCNPSLPSYVTWPNNTLVSNPHFLSSPNDICATKRASFHPNPLPHNSPSAFSDSIRDHCSVNSSPRSSFVGPADDTEIVHSLIFDSDTFLPIPRSPSLSVSEEKI